VADSATSTGDEEVRRRRATEESVVPSAFGQAGVPVHARPPAALPNGYGAVAGS
jgi:hypothetical protein